MNERLRRAIEEADLDLDDIARAAGVNHRTVERWIAGRVPYPRYRRAISKLVRTDEADLWPGVAPQSAGTSTSEVVNVYTERAYVPEGTWRRLVEGARDEINLLGSALFYVFDDPGFIELLWTTPCDVRIALADPSSTIVAERDDELRLGGTLATRIDASLLNLKHLSLRQIQDHRFELRLHAAPMYCSLFRVDDEMLVTPHVYGRSGRLDTPILHLRRREHAGIFDSYVQHFDDVFYKAALPLRPLPTREQGNKRSASQST
jgi:transcriptional regulator with XRE-family HTH domain